jgi:chemotaxis receptor (MCP) glutamine deamidase CheD
MPDDNRHHVAAGSYYIDTQKPMILEAYLGTCLGVAVYDPVAAVGGLIHLLLPEPMSTDGTFQPEKYASTVEPFNQKNTHPPVFRFFCRLWQVQGQRSKT